MVTKSIVFHQVSTMILSPQALLKVGDMLLACNTESFLSIGHEEATLILKQSTGNVRLLAVTPSDEVTKREQQAPVEPETGIAVIGVHSSYE